MRERYNRRNFIKGATAAVVLATFPAAAFFGNGVVVETQGLRTKKNDYSSAADNAYQKMMEFFYDPKNGLFKENLSKNNIPYSSAWSYEVIMRATLARLGDPRAKYSYKNYFFEQLENLHQYWDEDSRCFNSTVPSLTTGVKSPLKYYDDNGVLGLILLDAAEVLKDKSLIQKTKYLFDDFITTGQDQENPGFPGGIRWVQKSQDFDNDDIGMNSSVINSLLALRLFEKTRDEKYFDFASQTIDWCKNLKDPEDGLYWDKVFSDGSIDFTKWSYNQGFMVGYLEKLSHITNEDFYRVQAEQLASRSLDYYKNYAVADGRDGFFTQDIEFNSYFFYYLERLAKISRDASFISNYTNLRDSYIDEILTDPKYQKPGGLYFFPESSPTLLRKHAAFISVLSIASVSQL